MRVYSGGCVGECRGGCVGECRGGCVQGVCTGCIGEGRVCSGVYWRGCVGSVQERYVINDYVIVR